MSESYDMGVIVAVVVYMPLGALMSFGGAAFWFGYAKSTRSRLAASSAARAI
jgi:hypothetical protein